MRHRIVVALAVVALLAFPAYAENQMGYRLLTTQEAAGLPHNQGSLGLEIDRAQRITAGDMIFDIIRVTGVRAASAGAQAGFAKGDQIIALDGRVFPSLDVFAAYIGAARPGSRITVDYMPAGGGPEQAQRVEVSVGSAGQTATARAPSARVAISAEAVALLGCYQVGCLSHRADPSQP